MASLRQRRQNRGGSASWCAGQLKAFPRWVRVRRVTTTPEAWSIDNGLLTPTLKLKRPLVLAKFKDATGGIYGAETAGGRVAMWHANQRQKRQRRTVPDRTRSEVIGSIGLGTCSRALKLRWSPKKMPLLTEIWDFVESTQASGKV